MSLTVSADGRSLATGGEDGKVRLWDVASGREVRDFAGYRMHAVGTTGTRREGLATRPTCLGLSPSGVLLVFPATHGLCVIDATTRASLPFTQTRTELVSSLAYAPNGRWIAVGMATGETMLYDPVDLSKPAKIFRKGSQPVTAIAFAPDSTSVFIAKRKGPVRRWSVGGPLVRQFESKSARVMDLALSADGQRLVTGQEDGTVHVWDTASARRPIHRFDTNGPVHDVDVSPDGRHVLAVTLDQSIDVWDCAADGASRALGASRAVHGRAAAFVAGGAQVVVAGEALAAYDVASGRLVAPFGSEVPVLTADSVVWTADGAWLVVLEHNGPIRVWSVRTGQFARRIGYGVRFAQVSAAPSGSRILVRESGGDWFVLDAATGQLEATLPRVGGHPVISARLASDEQAVLGDGWGRMHRVDLRTGKTARSWRAHKRGVSHLAVATTSRRVLTRSSREATLWDLDRGTAVRRFQNLEAVDTPGPFSPSGEHLVLQLAGEAPSLWSAKSGRPLRRMQAPGGPRMHVQGFAFSPDGTQLLAHDRGRVVAWSVRTGEVRSDVSATPDGITSMCFSPDGHHVATAARNGPIALWDAHRMQDAPRAQLSFRKTHWLVRSRLGYFDGSRLGRVPDAYAVVGIQALDLAQVRASLYEPGLLARILRRGVRKQAQPLPPPTITVASRAASDPKIRVTARDTGGGIGPISVRVNGKKVLDDARGGTVVANAKSTVVTIDLAAHPQVLPGVKNDIELRAENTKGSARSGGLHIPYDAPGTPREPHLWALVCGVSDYAGTELDLEFAAKDALDFSAALRLAAEGEFGKERVHVRVLTSPAAQGALPATREHLHAWFAEAAAKVKSEDTVVLYLAGHGAMHRSKDKYHYLLAEAASVELSEKALASGATLSSAEIMTWMRKIAAVRRQFVILDTCSAGKLRDELRLFRASADLVNGLYESTGAFVLAGCAAHRSSYESPKYKQGLLTYAMLFGMKAACGLPYGPGGKVKIDVGTLMSYTQRLVPEAALDADMDSQLPVKLEGDHPFPLGTLSTTARRKIPLHPIKPHVVRASFELSSEPYDRLDLSRAVDMAVVSLRVGGALRSPLLFVDAPAMPGAHRLAGRYKIEGGQVKVSVFVYRDGEDGQQVVGRFEVTEREGAEAASTLAGKIARQADALLRASPAGDEKK